MTNPFAVYHKGYHDNSMQGSDGQTAIVLPASHRGQMCSKLCFLLCQCNISEIYEVGMHKLDAVTCAEAQHKPYASHQHYFKKPTYTEGEQEPVSDAHPRKRTRH